MATFEDLRREIRTVGDLRRALKGFPKDLLVGDPGGDVLRIVRVAPEHGEHSEHPLGYLLIEEDDGILDGLDH